MELVAAARGVSASLAERFRSSEARDATFERVRTAHYAHTHTHTLSLSLGQRSLCGRMHARALTCVCARAQQRRILGERQLRLIAAVNARGEADDAEAHSPRAPASSSSTSSSSASAQVQLLQQSLQAFRGKLATLRSRWLRHDGRTIQQELMDMRRNAARERERERDRTRPASASAALRSAAAPRATPQQPQQPQQPAAETPPRPPTQRQLEAASSAAAVASLLQSRTLITREREQEVRRAVRHTVVAMQLFAALSQAAYVRRYGRPAICAIALLTRERARVCGVAWRGAQRARDDARRLRAQAHGNDERRGTKDRA